MQGSRKTAGEPLLKSAAAGRAWMPSSARPDPLPSRESRHQLITGCRGSGLLFHPYVRLVYVSTKATLWTNQYSVELRDPGGWRLTSKPASRPEALQMLLGTHDEVTFSGFTGHVSDVLLLDPAGDTIYRWNLYVGGRVVDSEQYTLHFLG